MLLVDVVVNCDGRFYAVVTAKLFGESVGRKSSTTTLLCAVVVRVWRDFETRKPRQGSMGSLGISERRRRSIEVREVESH